MGKTITAEPPSVEQLAADIVKNGGSVSVHPQTGKTTLHMPLGGEEEPTLPVDLPKAHRATDDRLRLLIERVERLEEEKSGISEDIADVYAEAKSVGYDVKIMRKIVALRKMESDARREMEMLLETYSAALGMN